MTRKATKAANRRDFLKLAGTTAPLIAVGAVGLAAGTDKAKAATGVPSSDKMQDTVHTRAYYDSARF